MSSEVIRPSTLDGIKRLAKSIKAERGIQHVQALDEAARSASFENFRHARNVLPPGAASQRARPRHRVFLTMYWRDNESDTGGRETLTLWLGSPWNSLIRPEQLEFHRALICFRPDGPDHLACAELTHSQSDARRSICAAARTLEFMDATGLRPSKSHSRAFPGGRSRNAVPGRDHYSVWYDSDTKRYLFTDEPYEAAAQSQAAERAAWAERHAFTIVKPSWTGIYNPDGGTRLYLIADSQKGIPLAPVAAALDQLPTPIAEATWNGESAPSMPYFVSPGTITRAETVLAVPDRPRFASTGKRNSVGYVQTFAGPQRRPKGKMPIEAHAKVGGLLKSVLVESHHRKGVYNRVDSVRCELDEWVQREYSRSELPSDQFFDLYYHETGGSFARTVSRNERLRHVAGLEDVKNILTEHYPDSPPLRTFLNKLDGAIKSMQTWGDLSA